MRRLDWIGLVCGLMLAGLMTGVDSCEDMPPEPGNFYCAPATLEAEPSWLDEVGSSVEALYQTIVGGTPSTDRRSTVFVHAVGVGSCSGTVLDKRTVLTAAHCRARNPFDDPTPELRVLLDPLDPAHYYVASSHLVHPDYKPSDKGADLMLLYFDEDLPGPYVHGIYDPSWVNLCTKLTASGHGQTETDPEPCPDGKSRCLRESDYMVDKLLRNGSVLHTKQRTWGGICFGDSGGPLYAEVKGQGGPFLAGVTSWTQSRDCELMAGHVHADYFRPWLYANWQGIGVARPE